MDECRQHDRSVGLLIVGGWVCSCVGFVFLACWCVASAQGRFKNAERADAVTYRFSPIIEASDLQLHVRFEFRMMQVGRSSVLASEWAGEKLRSLSHLQAFPEGTAVEEAAEPGMVRLHGPANRPLLLSTINGRTGHYLSPTSQALLQIAVSRHGDLPAPAGLPVLGSCAHGPRLREDDQSARSAHGRAGRVEQRSPRTYQPVANSTSGASVRQTRRR